MSLEPLSRELLFTKNDPADPRLGDLVKPIDCLSSVRQNSFVLLGYPDDEGIRLNGGRPGAAQAPHSIRRVLYKMTPAFEDASTPVILDGGNLKTTGIQLNDRHHAAQKSVGEILSAGARAITLGGGHDYGYPDMAAFCEHTLKNGQKPFIVNFDAHLDVRPDNIGPHSGTPFFKLLREYAGKIVFHEVGLQDWCNSREHLRWALERKAHVHSLSKIQSSGLSLCEYVSRHIFAPWAREHRLALSVDIDGFSSSVAPAASQVFPTGFDLQDFMKMWTHLVRTYDPKVVGIYEVSPPLDPDDRTSRLAAILVHQRLFQA